MEIPFSSSTKFEYPPVLEGRVIHQTILHLLVWGFLFYPAKKDTLIHYFRVFFPSNECFPANRGLFSSRPMNTREERPPLAGNSPVEYQGKETSASRENTHWKKRKLWNNASVLFKMTLRTNIPRLYVSASLAFDAGQDGNGLQLEKTGPNFSSGTPVIKHYINNHFYASWFPTAV